MDERAAFEAAETLRQACDGMTFGKILVLVHEGQVSRIEPGHSVDRRQLPGERELRE